MGQYHYAVSMDANAHIDPHTIGSGLKEWEQISGCVPAALAALLSYRPGNMPADLGNHPMIGAWAGHRLLAVGDYAERKDIRGFKGPHLDKLYRLCTDAPQLTDYEEGSIWIYPRKGQPFQAYRTAHQQFADAMKDFVRLTKAHPNLPNITGQIGGLLESALSVRLCGYYNTVVPVEPYAVKGDEHAHYMLPKGTDKESRDYYFRMLGIPEGMQYPDTLPGGRWPWDRAPRDGSWHNLTTAQADEGQHRVFANLDRREFFDPAAFGEQPTTAGIMRASSCYTPRLAMDMLVTAGGGVEQDVKSGDDSGIGSASALFGMLLHREPRGGGDIDPEDFPIKGAWRNNRIVLTAEFGDDFPTTDEVRQSFTNISGEVVKSTAKLAARG